METKDKDEVVYYYNRAERLEKASPNARFIVDKYGAKRPGIIKSLTATRSLSFLFFLVLLSSVAVFVAFMVQGSGDRGAVAGNKLTVNAMWFENQVYVTVKRDGLRRGSARSTLELKIGGGDMAAVGLMQAVDDEFRVRLSVDDKPAFVIVLASVAGGGSNDGADDGNPVVKMVAKVE